MIKRFFIYIAIFISGLSVNLFAQGGSNYSVYGIGDIFTTSSAFHDGLAGTSIAFPAANTVNVNNPALWSYVTKTRLVAGYRFHQNYIKNENNHLLQNNGQLDGVHMLFSIDTSMGLSIGIGILPYTSVNYLIRNNQQFILEDQELEAIIQYQGSGGLTKGFIGGSIEPIDGFSLGLLGFATFGNIQSNTYITAFGLQSYPASSEGYNYYSGGGFNIGAIATPVNGLKIGAFYENYSELEAECEITYFNYSDPLYGNIIPDTTLSGSTKKIVMPGKFGIGGSYETGKFIIGADAAFQDFSSFDYNGGPETDFANSSRYSIGLSRIGNDAYYAPYLDKITYNFGLGYKKLYYEINGQNIDEMFLSVGFEFPIVGNAVLDAALTFGSRGTTNAGLVQEYFGRLMIDISLGETWFVPFRRE